MAKLVFHFTKRRLEDGTSLMEPKIPIVFTGSGAAIEAMATLDSGSTISYLPLDLAEILGFDKNRADGITIAKGIGGEEKASQFFVNLKIARKNQSVRLNNMPVLVFMDPGVKYCIIGLEPFFKKFDVYFKMSDDRIEIRDRQ
ncbi:MAG: retropepsin-like aspartic protease [Candidatus Micrarchaeota archaeon]|nr:retropepsin-like aspartic protease [Candidatus Micrarchaeota archaeon]